LILYDFEREDILAYLGLQALLQRGVKTPKGFFSSSMICTGEIEVGTPGQKIKAVEGDSPLVVGTN